MAVADAHRRRAIGHHVLRARRRHHRSGSPRQLSRSVRNIARLRGGIHPSHRPTAPGERGDLARIAAHTRAADFAQQAMDLGGSKRACSRPHGVQDHRYIKRVRPPAGPNHRVRGRSRQGPRVQDQRPCLCHHLFHLFRRSGHHRSGSEGQGDVGDVPRGHRIRDVMNERALLANPAQEGADALQADRRREDHA